MRLLLLDDDDLLADALENVLSDEGYVVDWCNCVSSTRCALRAADYEIAVFDIALPDGSGLELLRELRSDRVSMPVLLLTARDALEDRVTGLDGGADDYMAKPFAMDELLARLRALRRRRLSATDVYRHGEIAFDPSSRRVTVRGMPVALPRRETSILELFLENTGRVLSREYIYGQLYGWEDDVQSNTIEVYVHNLRRMLGTSLIRTVRGAGYVLDPSSGEHAA